MSLSDSSSISKMLSDVDEMKYVQYLICLVKDISIWIRSML